MSMSLDLVNALQLTVFLIFAIISGVYYVKKTKARETDESIMEWIIDRKSVV